MPRTASKAAQKAKRAQAAKPKKLGRPPLYTETLADDICTRVSLGGNLNKICAMKGMPSHDCVYRWLRENTAFYEKYTLARETRADSRSDRMDGYTQKMIDGKLDPNVVRVALINEQWQAGREAPKRYGTNRLEFAGDPTMPVRFIIMDGPPVKEEK